MPQVCLSRHFVSRISPCLGTQSTETSGRSERKSCSKGPGNRAVARLRICRCPRFGAMHLHTPCTDTRPYTVSPPAASFTECCRSSILPTESPRMNLPLRGGPSVGFPRRDRLPLQSILFRLFVFRSDNCVDANEFVAAADCCVFAKRLEPF